MRARSISLSISASRARSSARPLATGRSEGELRALWEKRRTSYAEAHVRIATSDEDPQRYVDEIIAELG